MKKKFSDIRQCIHVWAQQTQEEGECGNVFFKGNVIYSYGYHFPLAAFFTNKKGEKYVLINSESYSMSTSRHQHYVSNAVNGSNIRNVPTDVLQVIANRMLYDNKTIGERLGFELGYAIDQKRLNLIALLPGKREKTKGKLLQAFIDDADYYVRLADELGVKISRKIINACRKLYLDSESAVEAHLKEIERKTKEAIKRREEAERLEQVEQQEALAAFKAGDRLTCAQMTRLNHLQDIYLRTEGEEVVTSWGARFPISDAIRVYPHILELYNEAKEKGEYISVKEARPVSLGEFMLSGVTQNGLVHAGCHRIKFELVQEMAKKLGVA